MPIGSRKFGTGSVPRSPNQPMMPFRLFIVNAPYLMTASIPKLNTSSSMSQRLRFFFSASLNTFFSSLLHSDLCAETASFAAAAIFSMRFVTKNVVTAVAPM